MDNKLLTWAQRGQLWLRLGIRLGLAALAVWLGVRCARPRPATACSTPW